MTDTLKSKIKNEIRERLIKGNGTAELGMKKSRDIVIITTAGNMQPNDPQALFEMKSFKLQPVYAEGLDELAEEIMKYDETVKRQQKQIAELYAVKREKIDTGLATAQEKESYMEEFRSLFGYRPSI